MERTLTLELPEDIYEPLAETAKRRGATPEALAREWLATAVHHAMNDPVEAFIGAFESQELDWVDRHDMYLGEAAMQKVIGNEGESE